MTIEEADFIGALNMCDEISNEAYKKIMCHCEEQEPCEDCISRQAVLDYIDKMPSELTADGRRMIRRRTLEEYISDTLPPVTPQQKTGHWIEVIDEIDSLGNKTWHHKCSICGNEDSGWGVYKYCPNCGARMAESEG